MTNLSSIFNFGHAKCSGTEYKASLYKKNIISYFAIHNEATISDLSKELNVSVPTVTKLVSDLREDGYLMDYGKIETAGGRRPNVFGLAADVHYFLGVDISRSKMDFILINFKGEVVTENSDPSFKLENSTSCFETVIENIEKFISTLPVSREKIIGLGVGLTGRIDSTNGVSYTYWSNNNVPLATQFEERLGFPTYLENDCRAMVYAEKCCGAVHGERNVLLLNIGRGVGVGMLLEDKIYYGKTGFAGEFGHIPLFDNETMCYCGKKGCLETEASGMALEKMFEKRIVSGESSSLSAKYNETKTVTLSDIIDAVNKDDMLSISLIADLAEKMGRGIGVLINLLNPELIIVGGSLSQVGDYLMLPLKTAINKYSLSLVCKDTEFRLSKLGEHSSVLGVTMLVRAHILDII